MLRKAAVRLSLNTFTSLQFYIDMKIIDFFSIIADMEEVTKGNGK